MDSKRTALRKKIGKYIDVLRKEIDVDRVILFGSHAWGKPKSYSDIDLAIVSRDFHDENEIEDMQFLFRRACEIDSAIEPHPFHPKDLKKPDKRTLLYKILKEGKEIVCK